MKENRKDYIRDMLIVFLAVLIPRTIMIILFHGPLRTPMDEMATLSTAAQAAGYDWSHIVQASKHYYGGGFVILLAPLFKFIEAPGLLYASILFVFSIVQSLIAPIAYYISRYYFKLQSKLQLYIIAIISSFLVVTRSLYALNEHPLILLTWVIALILCKLCEYQNHRKKKAIYTILLFVTMSYALTVHTRAQIYWIAMVVFLIWYWIFYKKIFVSVIPGILTAFAGYHVAQRVVDWIQDFVWLASEGEKLHNTKVNVKLSFEMLKDTISWQAWANIVTSQIQTCVVFTVGFAAIAIIVAVVFYVNKCKKFFVLKEKSDDTVADKVTFVLFSFYLLCTGGTIFGQSLTWLNKLYQSYINGPYDAEYADKALTYIRYYGPYIGPFLMMAILYCICHHDKFKESMKWIITFFCVLQFIFVCYILPTMAFSEVASEVYWPFSLRGLFGENYTSASLFLMGVIVCAVFFVLFLVCLYKKKYTVFLGALACMLLFQYVWNGIYWEGKQMQRVSDRVNAGYQLIQELEENHDVPDTIYCRSTVTGGQHSSYVYQFMLKEYKINTRPKKGPDTIILCNNESVDRIVEKGYVVYTLDNNEYVAVVSEYWQNAIEDLGYSLYQIEE